MAITRDEIDRCIELLHPIYHSCNVKILRSSIVFVIQSIIKRSGWKNIKDVLSGNGIAWYDIKEKAVYLPIFSLNKLAEKDNELLKIYAIHCLFHELRHHYQYRYKPRLVKRRCLNISVGSPNYISDPTERDADRFADRMCEKYKDEINEILNIDFEWSAMGNVFEINRNIVAR